MSQKDIVNPLLIKITESPRDALQGIKSIIPIEKKVELINSLLKVGFDILDFGSFVSPRAIPQLADTAKVLNQLNLSETVSKLMVVTGNLRGARSAAEFDEIDWIAFPFSFSETFLKLNINANQPQACKIVDNLKNLCLQKNKKLSVYISMAFGNPYGDPWSIDLIVQWAKYLEDMGVDLIALSDIIGIADDVLIRKVFEAVFAELNKPDIALHLHTTEQNWYSLIDAAYSAGCRRFDGVLSGFGGCPMTGYELIGNLDTRFIIDFCDQNNIPITLDRKAIEKAYSIAIKTYNETGNKLT